jgi:lipoate-protein ligase B
VTKAVEKLPLHIIDCGLADYRRILDKQLTLSTQRHENKIPNTILIVEHPAVITLGARQSANKLLRKPQQIKQAHIDIVDIRRGGGSTAHNPGQVVFYPIVNLRELKLGINKYIRLLERIGIELLELLSVKSQRKKGFPGLWVKQRKIASIGVRVSKFITYHGMAINIQNDLSIFEFIIPCGLDDIEITSVYKETGRQFPIDDIKKKLSRILIKHFSSEELAEYEKSR